VGENPLLPGGDVALAKREQKLASGESEGIILQAPQQGEEKGGEVG